MFGYPCRSSGRLGEVVCVAIGLVVLSLGSPRAAFSDEPGTGEVFGKVTITRSLAAQRMRFRLYSDFKPQPPPDSADYRTDEWANVVIYLEMEHDLPAPDSAAANPQMIQEGETFIPHVLPIRVGSTVEFPNHDPIFHNVFSLSRVNTFDLGRYPEGESRSVTFDRAGIVPVFCHLHSDMSAIVLVLENHLFTNPGTEGRYRVPAVPAGEYTLVAWHPRAEPVRVPLSVAPGQSVELDLTVPIVDEEGRE